MNERIVYFGALGALNGVFRDGAIDAPAWLFFNAGVVHRIGPHRLNVKLARAAAGPSLRFDLSGQGESAPAGVGLGHENQAAADIVSAVDALLDQTGQRRVIAVGLCSGADNAVRAALEDRRIAGLVLLDPYAYPNSDAASAEFLDRASDPVRWRAKLKEFFGGDKRPPDGAGEAEADATARPEQGRPTPPREVFGAQLQRLAARGCRMLVVHTGLVRRHVSAPEHFFETFVEFDFAGAIHVETMPYCDHTFTPLAAQEALKSVIAQWSDAQVLAHAETAPS